jgi:glycerol-3-phosphate dehydrogenase subunit B
MRFDVVIMGGGLAGYAAAIALLEAGKSAALLSIGQSSLHFSSGSLDFLHSLPDGREVLFPEKALGEFTLMAPGHPYAILGPEETLSLGLEAEKKLASWKIPLKGSLKSGNHLRMSPMGKLIPTWLSSADAVTFEIKDGKPIVPFERVFILTVRDFLDFNTEIAKASLEERGMEISHGAFSLPDLETLRENPSEFRAVNIARILDKRENRYQVGEEVKKAAKEADAVFLPALLGLNHPRFVKDLRDIAHKPVFLIPTLTPSMLGARLHKRLSKLFLKYGGVLMPKDQATGFDISEKDEGLVIERIRTHNHGDVPLRAQNYVLATGGFFSKGLLSDRVGVREAVFDLDLAEEPGQRGDWSAEEFFSAQPFQSFGVKVDSSMRPSLKGKRVLNLRAAGLVLGGLDPIRLGCGGGASLVASLKAADSILKDG